MPNLLLITFETLFIFSPAIFGNMAPVFADHYNLLSSLAIPADFNKKLNGVRILGKNKTIRGFVFAVIIGFIVGIIQYLFSPGFFTNEAYSQLHTSLISASVISFGALLGDALGSFIKRQLHISPGQSLPVIDQVDYLIGSLFFVIIFFPLTIYHVIISFVLLGSGSFFASVIGKQTGLKKEL